MKRFVSFVLVSTLIIWAGYNFGHHVGYEEGLNENVLEEHILAEVYEVGSKDPVFMTVLEAGEKYQTDSYVYPLKMTSLSLTLVRNKDIDEAQREARDMRIQDGWDLSSIQYSEEAKE